MQRKSSIRLIFVFVFLLIIGFTLGITMQRLNWDFSKISAKYETNTYEINQSFKDITITTKTSDIVFKLSDDGQTSVICYEHEKIKHNISVADDALAISVTDSREWYDHIGIHFNTPKITVCLPRQQYNALSLNFSTGDVYIPQDFRFESMDIAGNTGSVRNSASTLGNIQIKTNTGNIRIQGATADTMDLTVSTGEVFVADVTVKQDINIKTTTGDTDLRNVIAEGKMTIEQGTGDIDFDCCDGSEIFLKTNTGDIEGSFLTEKIFVAKSNTGDVDVPRTTTGGKCEVTTNTGDIEIEIR